MAESQKLYKDFSGGLVTRIPATHIKRSQTPDCGDMISLPGGALVSRLGKTKLMDQTSGNAGKAVTMLANYTKSDGTKEVLVAYAGLIKKLNMATGAVTDLPTPVSGQADTAQYGFNIYDDNAFFCNGQDSMIRYTGSANATVTLTNLAAAVFYTNVFIFTKDGKMFAIDAGNTKLLHRSKTDLGTASDIYTFNYSGGTALTNSGTTNIKEDGTPLTALQVLDDLYLFTNKSIAKLVYDSALTAYVPVNVAKGSGAYTNPSLVTTGSALIYFDSDDKVFSQLGQVERYPQFIVTELSDAIRNLTTETYDFTSARSIYWNRLFLTACKSSSSASVNDTVIVFDIESRAVWRIPNWYVNCWMEYDGKLYYGSAQNPVVYQCFVGTADDGGTIPFYWTSNIEDFASPELYKNSFFLYVEGTIDQLVNLEFTLTFNDGAFQVIKTIEGDSTEYTTATNTLSSLGVAQRGIYTIGGIAQEGSRIFRVWLELNCDSFHNVQTQFRNTGGVGSASIRQMKFIGLTGEDEQTIPSNRII